MSEHIPKDEFTPEDYALLQFVTENASQYGRFEIFLRAKEQVEILSGKTTSWLYKRYHRELYPMIVGEPSKEYEELHPAQKRKQDLLKCKMEDYPHLDSECLPIPAEPEVRIDNNALYIHNNQSQKESSWKTHHNGVLRFNCGTIA